MATLVGTGFIEIVPKLAGSFGPQLEAQLVGGTKAAGEKAASQAGRAGAQGGQSFIGGMRSALAGMGPMITAAVGVASIAGIAAFAKSSVDAFKQVAGESVTLQRVMGGTIQQASEWRAVGERFGIDTNQMSVAMKTLAKDMTATKGPLQDLGIATKDAHGAMLPMGDVLMQVSDKFKAMPDGAEKSRLAVQLFGKSGLALLPILDKGSAGITELMDAAKKMGLVMDASATDKVKKLKAAQADLKESITGVKVAIGEQLTPALTWFNTMLTEHVIPAVGKAVATLTTQFKPILSQLGPLFKDLADAAGKVLKLFVDLVGPVVKLGLALVGLALEGTIQAFKGLATAVGEISGFLDRNKGVVILLAAAWAVLNREVAVNIFAGGVLLISNALRGLQGAFTSAGGAMTGFLGNIRSLGAGSLALGAAAFSVFTLAIVGAVGMLYGLATANEKARTAVDALTAPLKNAGNDLGKYGDVVQSLNDRWKQVENNLFGPESESNWASGVRNLKNFFGVYTGSTSEAIAESDQLQQAIKQVTAQTNQILTNQTDLAWKYHLTADQVHILAQAYKIDMTQGSQAAAVAFAGLVQRLKDGAPASSDLKNKIVDLATQTQAADDAAKDFKTGLDALFGKFLSYDEAATNMATSIQAIGEKARAANGHLGTMSNGMIQGTKEQLALRTSIQQSLGNIDNMTQGLIKMGKTPAEASAAFKVLSDQIYNSAVAAGVSKADLDAMYRSMHLIPPGAAAAASGLQGLANSATTKMPPAATAVDKIRAAFQLAGDKAGYAQGTVDSLLKLLGAVPGAATPAGANAAELARQFDAIGIKAGLSHDQINALLKAMGLPPITTLPDVLRAAFDKLNRTLGDTKWWLDYLQGAQKIQDSLKNLGKMLDGLPGSVHHAFNDLGQSAEGAADAHVIPAVARIGGSLTALAAVAASRLGAIVGSENGMAAGTDGATGRVVNAMSRHALGLASLALQAAGRMGQIIGSEGSMAGATDAVTTRVITAFSHHASGLAGLAGAAAIRMGQIIGSMGSMATSTEQATGRAIGAFIRMQGSVDSLHGKHIDVTSTADVTISQHVIDMTKQLGIAFRAADGGILPSQATIARPTAGRGLVQWAEPETGGEAFIPLAPQKRKRSVEIWRTTGELLGQFATGGLLNIALPDINSAEWLRSFPAFQSDAEGIATNLGQRIDNKIGAKIGTALTQKVTDALTMMVAALQAGAGGGGGGVADSNAVVAFAKTLIGSPYRPPYYDPSGFSCDGLVWYVFKHFGINLPTGATNQMNSVQRLQNGQQQPGDVVGFHQDGPSSGNPLGLEFHHIGLVTGMDQMIDALGTAYGVRVDSISNIDSGPGHYVRFGRVLQNLNPGWTPGGLGLGAGVGGGSGGRLSRGQVAALVAQVGLPAHMVDVAWRESGFDPRAVTASGVNPPFVYGLWQILAADRDNLFDPLTNAIRAKQIFDTQGPGAWAQTWANGGLVGASYDSGGWLPPGLSLAYNGTGKPERVGGGVQNNSVSITMHIANGDPVTMKAAAQQVVDDALTALARRLSSGAGRN